MFHDPQLIAAARQGDEAALLHLLENSQLELRRIAATQCASAADADDAVQEGLWQVYRRIGALRTIASYTAWVFSIIRHECQRLMRRMHGHTELLDEDSPLLAYHTTPGLHLDLAAAIESLPEPYREAIILRDFEEYSIAEIADALRLTRQAVKSRIHRARVMVREYLAA